MILLDIKYLLGGRRGASYFFIIFNLTGISFQLCSSSSLVLPKILSKCTLPDVWARQTLEIGKKQIKKLPLAFSFSPYFFLSLLHIDCKLHSH